MQDFISSCSKLLLLLSISKDDLMHNQNMVTEVEAIKTQSYFQESLFSHMENMQVKTNRQIQHIIWSEIHKIIF